MGCLTLYFVHLRLYSYIMITHIRVASQQLEQPRFESPKELVSWMGAIQAQEYEMAKWAIGIRLRSSSLETVNEALYKGDILRTHVMRPTWHFVAAEDIRWMLMLSSERIKAAVMSYAKGHFGKIEKNAVHKIPRSDRKDTGRIQKPDQTRSNDGIAKIRDFAHHRSRKPFPYMG